VQSVIDDLLSSALKESDDDGSGVDDKLTGERHNNAIVINGNYFLLGKIAQWLREIEAEEEEKEEEFRGSSVGEAAASSTAETSATRVGPASEKGAETSILEEDREDGGGGGGEEGEAEDEAVEEVKGEVLTVTAAETPKEVPASERGGACGDELAEAEHTAGEIQEDEEEEEEEGVVRQEEEAAAEEIEGEAKSGTEGGGIDTGNE
jgi:hypothetical protein